MTKLLTLFLFALLINLISEGIAADNPDAKSETAISQLIAKQYLAGEFAARRGDFEMAADKFSEALEKTPEDRLLLQNGYKFSLLAGRYERAEVYADRYIKKYGNSDTGALLIMATMAASKRDFVEASAILSRIDNGTEKQRDLAQDIILPFIRVWVAAGEQNYDLALNMLDPKDISKFVSGAFIAVQKGLLLSLSGDNVEAEKVFAPLMGENFIMPYNMAKAVATFYEATGKWDEAGKVYKQYTRQHPTLPHFDNDEARVVAKITDGSYIKTSKDGMAEVIKEAARLLFSNQLYEEGLLYLRLSLILKPEDDEAKTLLAGYYEQVGNTQKAIDLYNNIAKTSDFYIIAQVSMAENLYNSGKKDQAKKILFDLSDNIKAKYIPFVTIADLFRRDNQFKEAIKFYTKVIENIDSKSAQSWAVFFARGMCYERSGNWQKAQEDLEAALARSPNQPEVVNYLAYSWIEHNMNLEKARDMLLKAVLSRPDNPEIIDSAGWALYKLKDYNNSVRFLEKAAELMPQDALINEHLGDAYWMSSRRYEARYQWQRAIKYASKESSSTEILNKKITSGLEK